MRYFLGIDPGVSGALVVIDDIGRIQRCTDIPTFSPKAGSNAKVIDLPLLLKEFQTLYAQYVDPAHGNHLFASLEQMPTVVASKQGAMATIAKGRNEAYCEMGLVAAGIAYQKVYPVSWKAALKLGSDKQKVVLDAVARWPADQHLFRGPRGGYYHDRAEAALLAEYGRRCG